MANARESEKSKGTSRQAERKEDKPARIPFGGMRYRLQLSKEDMAEFDRRKMKTYWFNDKPGRIERAKAGGYTFVKPEHATSMGSGAIHRQGNDPESAERVSIVVSEGEPIVRAYLMEIPLKFWKEDQKAKEAQNFMVEEQLNVATGEGGEKLDNQYGSGVTYSH